MTSALHHQFCRAAFALLFLALFGLVQLLLPRVMSVAVTGQARDAAEVSACSQPAVDARPAAEAQRHRL